MDPFVFAAVLFAALCHASWNSLLKIRLDPFAANALITVASGLIAAAALPFVGVAPILSWPWLVASIILHLAYYYGLTEAYRTGDLSQVYPIARGAAPLMTAVISTTALGEDIGLFGWIGILSLVSGVFLLSIRGGSDLTRIDRRAVGFAFFTAVTICGYSLTDGIGARVSGNAHAYAALLFLLDGFCMAVVALWRRGQSIITEARIYWKTGLFGGALSVTSYWIAIWAMTVAPIAIVAALRETSVLFAAVISVVILKEQLRPARVIAALMIVFGLALIRLH
ncbi:MAG TPA: DMT family transporter [Xanthobacteraceae bacterium]|jgi:drug/metabolite transporter (DMT)-like permease|nr:DMT family transporter [Xanthobacteraceae bacterium]